MAKEWKVSNAKVEINGEDYTSKAHTWNLGVGVEGTLAVVSCHKLDGEAQLSVKKNPNPSLLLVDGCGIELRYNTELTKVETTEEVGSVTQVVYYFKVIEIGGQ